MFQKVQEIMSVILGLRKLVIMLALILIAIVFREKALIDGGQLVDLLKTTTLAFFGSNSVEHIKSAISSYMDTKTGKEVKEVDSTVGDS